MTAIVNDSKFLLHDTGQHPESLQRLRAIDEALSSSPFFEQCEKSMPSPPRTNS
jgi:hypothetical protein